MGHHVPADLERRMAATPGAVVYGARALPAGVVGPLPAGVGERAFQAWVIAVGRANGWLAFHARPAVNRRGKWSTAFSGDAGFPDCVLVKPASLTRGTKARVIVAELKVKRRSATALQRRWLEAFELAGVPTYCWWPEDAEAIRRILSEP